MQRTYYSEKEFIEREELAKAIEEDTEDDYLTPEQDTTDEDIIYSTAEHIITEGMTRNMKELGNDRLYNHIEKLHDARQRARFRKYFLLVGGQIPQGEPITI